MVRHSWIISLCCTLIAALTVGGVSATWKYATASPLAATADIPLEMDAFVYIQEMPEAEVTLMTRISDLLNNVYHSDAIPEGQGRQYLLTTLDKDFDTGHNPALGSFVGSMDPTAESQDRIRTMFGDVIDFDDPSHVSFILKSEDLVGSVENEIALYSTSDPLTWNAGNWMHTVVGVYLSVFVPVVDENGVTVGYDMLCDSVHGYCLEVQYMENDYTPSFSTDHWRDELFYWHESYADPMPITGEDRYKYECYHPADGNYAYPGRTQTWLGWIIVQTNQWEITDFTGKRAWQKLAEILEAQQ